MVGPLRRVLVKRPDEAFAVEDPERWHYTSRPDLDEARREHDALVEILTGAGAEVIDHRGLWSNSEDVEFATLE